MANRTVLIAGGTGMLGKLISEAFVSAGFAVRILTRNQDKVDGILFFDWDPTRLYCNPKAIEGVDVIVNLSGAGIADKRWSKARKQELIESRVRPTQTLCKLLTDTGTRVHYVAASGINCVPTDSGNLLLDERADYGTDFLSHIVQQWEDSVLACAAMDKTTILRISTVLSTQGGALAKMEVPFRYFIGSPLGKGDQWMCWIHEKDLVEAFVHVVVKDLSGVFNLTGEPVINRDFSKSLAKALSRPMIPVGVPAFMLRLLLGEMSDILLTGARCSSARIQESGFVFSYPKIDDALADLYAK